MSNSIKKHLNLLGLRVKDKVTGVEGVVDTLSFDLYGCIQGCINTGFDANGKKLDNYWYDVTRFEILSPEPVMDRPDFAQGYVAEGKKGPADKPAM